MLIILMSLTDGMVQPPQTSDQMRNLAYAYNLAWDSIFLIHCRHLSSSSKLLLQCGVSHHGEKEEEDLFQPKRVGSPHRQRVIDSLSSRIPLIA